MSNFPRIIFFVIGNKIVVRLGGKHKTIVEPDDEARADLVAMFREYVPDKSFTGTVSGNHGIVYSHVCYPVKSYRLRV